MDIIANNRTFDYDIESLLGYAGPPVLPEGEVSLLISGLPGTGSQGSWNGLGNGTHALNGTEVLNAYYQYWTYITSGTAYTDLIYLREVNTTAYKKQVVQIRYDGLLTTPVLNYGVATGTPAPAIGPALFSSKVIKDVTFTWSKGRDWDRGNMNV